MIVHSTGVNAPVKRSGITLTEILISILIMGIGMVSLATLFPLGLLKLRDAARFSRSAYLAESAGADLAARGLLSKLSFQNADSSNALAGLSYTWYASTNYPGPNGYDPFTQDTPSYGGDPIDHTNGTTILGARSTSGFGLPVAYDPLWRWQTGIYLDPINQSMVEARFASGIGFIRNDPGDNGTPSAYGLQRLTNFNLPAITPSSVFVPSIFVSPEDVVWQNSDSKMFYPMAWNMKDPFTNSRTVDSPASPLIPDLSISMVYNAATGNYSNTYMPVADWRYSWMFTGRQVSSGSAAGANYDGDIVIFENRPCVLDTPRSMLNNRLYPQAAGEQVVEAVFGYTTNPTQVDNDGNFYYGVGANKTVLLRWPAGMTDPEVKVGSWIADVTYERTFAYSSNNIVLAPNTRFPAFTPLIGIPGLSTCGQRCLWYQVVKVNQAAPAVGFLAFGSNPGVYRSMIVKVATPLRAYTQLNTDGSPYHVNAALVSPNVVQVIPRTFTVN